MFITTGLYATDVQNSTNMCAHCFGKAFMLNFGYSVVEFLFCVSVRACTSPLITYGLYNERVFNKPYCCVSLIGNYKCGNYVFSLFQHLPNCDH